MTDETIEVFNIDSIMTDPPAANVKIKASPWLTHEVEPKYPEEARDAGIKGSVRIKIWITERGSVKKGIVIHSTDKIFNQESLRAIAQWQFSPSIDTQGNPTAIWAEVSLGFGVRDLRRKIEGDTIYVMNLDSLSAPRCYSSQFIGVEKQPGAVHHQLPEYSDMLRRRGMHGKVWVKLYVTELGIVSKASILSSDSNALNVAALYAATEWTFFPATDRTGNPVPVWVSIPFSFGSTR
jgi:TonB family protein